jgi:hypothetical protein
LETYLYKELVDKCDSDSSLKIPLPQSKIFRIKDWSENRGLIDDRYLLEGNENENCIVFHGPDSLTN